jgi:hypothetical protein
MADIKLKLKPFGTPNFVIAELPPGTRQEGIQDPPKWALSELDAETLAKLCDDFRAEVFRKAGKADPVIDLDKR